MAHLWVQRVNYPPAINGPFLTAFFGVLSLCLLSSFCFMVQSAVAAVAPQRALSESLPQQIRFQHLLENSNITVGEVPAFLQDEQGFMWVGSAGGLFRYDGYEYKVVLKTIRRANGKKYLLEEQPAKNINHLYQDSEHILWVSTRSGLLRYDPRTELLTEIPDEPNSEALSTTRVEGVIELPSGELLVAAESGLFVLNRATLHYTVMQPDMTKKTGSKAFPYKYFLLTIAAHYGLAPMRV